MIISKSVNEWGVKRGHPRLYDDFVEKQITVLS
jgi:hypothetical protein